MFNTRLVAAVLLTVFTLTSLAANIPVKTAPQPVQAFKVKKVIDANFADPAFTIFNGTWYAYATTGNGVNAQVATSKDGENWTLLRGLEPLPNPGRWADQSRPGIWAPDVVVAGNGKYVMYYSAKLPGLNRHCIGAAVADKPTGPFRAQAEPFACPSAAGGAIDAAGFKDADGKRYVVYKVDGNNIGRGGNCNNGVRPIVPTPIMLQQVSPADGLAKAGAPVQILNRDPADGPLVEAPSLTRTSDGKYVLFYSSNCYSGSKYDIAYAFADRVAGPYTKVARFAVTGMGGLYAPGGADISPDGKRMVFHASNGKGGRGMFTAQIAFDSKRRLVSTV
ncbi:hypothetical protein SLS56_007676 [Neofusicoccum ribis]|uniref:Glycoside hydrolase family 43 protein n=1 Tax=Neofusicoccum ribis TaxID=45134 RepID=A0ABR3SMR7_9PEZI